MPSNRGLITPPREVPAEYHVTGYPYTYVNEHPVLVEPRTRRVVKSSLESRIDDQRVWVTRATLRNGLVDSAAIACNPSPVKFLEAFDWFG